MQQHYLDWGSSQVRWGYQSGPPLFHQPGLLLRKNREVVMAVGVEAEKYRGRVPTGLELVEPFVAGVPQMIEPAAQFGQIVITRLHQEIPWWQRLWPRELVWVVPQNISAVERMWYLELAAKWGYYRTRLVPTALAVAAYWLRGKRTNQPTFIMHIGSSRMLLAVVVDQTVLWSRETDWGMARCREAIRQWVADKQQLLISQATAEQILQTVGGISGAETLSRECGFFGKQSSTQLTGTGVVTGSDLQQIWRILEQELTEGLLVMRTHFEAETFKDIPVLLSGGGAKIDGLANWLKKQHGLESRNVPQPAVVPFLGISQYART